MAKARYSTLTFTDVTGSSSGWIHLDTFESPFDVGFQVVQLGSGEAPILNIEATLQNLLTSASVAANRIFAVASAVSGLAVNESVVGALPFPVTAVRLTSIASGGSGASTLRLGILQTGPSR